jgi:hypothetical protein
MKVMMLTPLAGDYIKTLPDHIQWLLMQVEFIPCGKDMLKHCLKTDKPLKIRTDGSLNLRKEMASFGWLLIGCVFPQSLGQHKLNCLELQP